MDNDNDSSYAMVITTMVSDYFDHSPPLVSVKTLIKLIRNASTPPDPSKSESFRKVRLSNKAIRDRVVHVPGALDLLGLVGFVSSTENKEEYLVYTPTNQDEQLKLVETLLLQLNARVTEMEAKQKDAESNKRLKSSASPKPLESSPFLSEKERLERQKKAQEAKRQRALEREETRRRWMEDSQNRKEAAQRKEAANREAVKEFIREGISIKPMKTATTKNSAAGPLEEPVATGPVAVPDHRAKAAAAWKAAQEASAAAATQSSVSPTDKEVDSAEKEKDAFMSAETADSGLSKQQKPSAQEHDYKPSDKDAAATATPASLQPIMDAPSQEAKQMIQSDDQEDRKPAAVPDAVIPPPSDEKDSSISWEECMEKIPPCEAAPGIRDTSYYSKSSASGERRRPKCLKRLLKELDSMKESLPVDSRCTIWVRFDEDSPQYMRALVVAPLPGPTPYSGGLFCFDVYIPDTYPSVPPKLQLLTTGGGTVRFGPNLYADGKVCLSLLGTWPGPKWSPKHSTLSQVLISIQGLILGVEHPYYLEPGHGGWEGKVKEGDFTSVGHNLKGEEIKQELNVPQHVCDYEDVLRVGTIKFALLEMVQKSQTLPYLQPFATAIQAHFYYNRTAILQEVHLWQTSRPMTVAAAASSPMQFHNRRFGKQDLQGQLQKLYPRLEAKLMALTAPDFSNPGIKDPPAPMDIDEAKQPQEDKADPDAPPAKKPSSSPLDDLKREMKEAATKGNFIRAGKLQEQVQKLEDLQKRIQEAASEGNFIRAGRLQEQFQALVGDESTRDAGNMHDYDEVNDYDDDVGSLEDYDDGQDNAFDDHGDLMDYEEDDEFENMGPPPGMAAALGMMGGGTSKNVFTPANYANRFRNARHSWGTGNQLGATAGGTGTALPASAASSGSVTVAPPERPVIAPERVCRLRIRLPGSSKSVVEDFDKEDPLSAVYHRLEPQVQDDDKPARAYDAASPSGAFAQPRSAHGFTLLLSHPKREYSLEMHGTKSLEELGLAPSASLVVMMCASRGVVYRGELESRLRQAQGDAVDVEGLTYEGLLELTDRVGTASSAVDHGLLEEKSSLLCPASHISSLQDGADVDPKCLICLGEFDATDTEPSLRQLHACQHVFHKACLETWLVTKPSCPICKTSLSE